MIADNNGLYQRAEGQIDREFRLLEGRKLAAPLRLEDRGLSAVVLDTLLVKVSED